MQIKFIRFSFAALFLSLLLSFSHSAQTTRPNFNRLRTYDVQHYVIRVSFNRGEKKVFGDTTVRLKPLGRNFRRVELDAAGMDFEWIRLESGGGKDLKYKQSGEKLTVELDKAYSPSDLIYLRFKYSSKPEKGVYFVEERRENGKIVYPSHIWTQGQPEEAHHWFPSYDFPDDKATSEQLITVERDETAVGNGELLETLENADGTKTFHYKMAVPYSTYLTSFVVGKYVKITDSYKKIPLGFYVYPGRESLVGTAFGKTKDMLRIFEQLTSIDYPFNKYDQTIISPKIPFSAMENITATTLSERDMSLAQYPATRGLVEDIVSHEIAHAWFGNLVTCRNWAELWLNEGFATFMEAAYREKMYGREDYLRSLQSKTIEHFAENLPRSKTHGLFNHLARPDDSIFDTTTYQKGGLVIHMLREEIGDKAFWKAVNLYLTRHKFGTVETPDLQKAMEEASEKKLDWFFRQWVYGAGYPKLEIRQAFDREKGILALTVDQIQEAGNLVPEAFRLPLELEIETDRGNRTEKILINRRVQTFSIKLESEPERIEFDKNLKIPLKTIRMR